MTKSKEFTIRLDQETQEQVEDYLARTGVSLNVFAAGAMRAAIDAEASDHDQTQALAAQREAAEAKVTLSEAARTLAQAQRQYEW